MSRYFYNPLFGFIVAIGLGTAVPAWGVLPAEDLLPDTTKLFISVPNVEAFRKGFEKTQIGQLATDPIMKPFADDLRGQIRGRLADTEFELGLTWEDLEGIYGGEACLARLVPGGKTGHHATVMIVDATNHPKELESVKKSVQDNMQKRNAVRRTQKLGDVEVVVYTLPKTKVGEVKPREVFLYTIDDQFVATNDISVAGDIIKRSAGIAVGKPLKSHPDFSTVMSKLATEAGTLTPHARWFVVPLDFADLLRSSSSLRKQRGKDILEILRSQGFDAIHAVGGHLNFSTETHDLLHRTMVYAPPLGNGPNRYKKAANMLAFPASQHFPIRNWVPRSLATFVSFNWKVRESFEFSTGLVDEIVDSERFVDDVLDSLEKDPQGPQINLRTELLDFLSEHVVMFSDYRLPMSPKSERILAAIKVTDENQVSAALRKLWQTDPTARERSIRGQVVWEIVPEEADELPDFEIPGIPAGISDSDEDQIQLPNAAMTVAYGYLLVSSHIDYLNDILSVRPAHDTLGESADFQLVAKNLKELGAGEDSFLYFSRMDEEYRSAYEMIREGKMPQSESILGKLLNRFLGPDEKGVLRQQEIDGKNLPEYQVVRRYLGPAGLFVNNRPDGWMATGVVLSKQHFVEENASRASLQTAAKQ